MTISEILVNTTVDKLDCEVMLALALEKERTWMLAHSDTSLTEEQKSAYGKYLERRTSGEPLAYITGEKEFYGRRFIVNPDVLIPRPSTEGMIDLTLNFIKAKRDEVRDVDNGIVCVCKQLRKFKNIQTIVDVGTGSGCIAITLALELPKTKLIATDISNEALGVARVNAQLHGVDKRIAFRQGRGLKPVEELNKPFLLVSNPPYIPERETIQKEVRFEPKDALFAGEDGMDVIRELIGEAKNNSNCRGYVMECRKDQASSLLD